MRTGKKNKSPFVHRHAFRVGRRHEGNAFIRSMFNRLALLAAIAVYGVCRMSCVASRIIPRKERNIHPIRRVGLAESKKNVVDSDSRGGKEKKNRGRESLINFNLYPYQPPSPSHPLSRSTTRSSHLPSLLALPLPPLLLLLTHTKRHTQFRSSLFIATPPRSHHTSQPHNPDCTPHFPYSNTTSSARVRTSTQQQSKHHIYTPAPEPDAAAAPPTAPSTSAEH
jgi:hypothetical protein